MPAKLPSLRMQQQYEQQDAGSSSTRSSNIESGSYAARAVLSDDFLHELRQPLSAIESLAYYVELTSDDEAVKGQMHRIQAMVMQASRILAQAEARPVLASHGETSF